jgi:hypothetical protein
VLHWLYAFGKRSKKLKKKAVVEFTIGRDLFEGILMMSTQLNSDPIIGCQLLKEYFILNFEKGSVSYSKKDTLENICYCITQGR